MSFVEFRNVWLAYDDALLAKGQFAVEDISLQVAEGAFIAIVGHRRTEATRQGIIAPNPGPAREQNSQRGTIDRVLNDKRGIRHASNIGNNFKL